MSMAEAINQAERSFNTAQTSIDKLKSARDPNDQVFKKALTDLVSSLKDGSQALSNIENMSKSSKGILQPNLFTKIQRLISAFEKDPTIQSKVAALHNAQLQAELQTHLSNINSKTAKLSLRRGERVANVEHPDTQG